jgi:transcriptional antiterminator RfaH
MNLREGRRWYVIRTHPHAEAKAADNLRRQGFETYMPRYWKQRRHARRIETVAAALFPRYLFVAFDMATERWHSIRSTHGVAQIVGGENGPAYVPEGIVEDIRKREGDGDVICVDAPIPFRKGERVKLTDGVLSVCSGFFEGLADKDRVAILLDMLGRRVRVVVGRAEVAAA